MATPGSPKLAVQTASILRLLTKTEVGFVQLASSGLSAVVLEDEPIYFLDDRIICRKVTGTTGSYTTTVELRDFDLNILSSVVVAVNRPSPTLLAYDPTNRVIGGMERDNAVASYVTLSPDGNTLTAVGVPTGFPVGPAGRKLTRPAFSPDGQIFLACYSMATTFIEAYQRSGATFIAGSISGQSGPVGDIAWTRDSRYAISNPKNASYPRMQVFKRTGGALALVASLSTETFEGHEVSIAPNGVFVASSFVKEVESLLVYTTDIFKRSGDDFIRVVRIDNFGALLDWSEDGSMLYDASLKRMFTRTGNTFAENTGQMTNIPAGVLQSAVSMNIDYPVGLAYLYDDVLLDMLSGTQDRTNWRIALLTASASFTPTETVLANILVNEVSGNGWTAGGEALTGVEFISYGGNGARLITDNIAVTIFGGNLTASYAVIYDDDADRPLVFIDFQGSHTITGNNQLRLEFSPNGIALITS